MHNRSWYLLDESGWCSEDPVVPLAREVSVATDGAVVGATRNVQLHAHPEPGGEVDASCVPDGARHHPGGPAGQAHVHVHTIARHDLTGGVANVW